MSDRTHAAHALKLKAGPAWAGHCLRAATNRPTRCVLATANGASGGCFNVE
jgi:hypothetical protein